MAIGPYTNPKTHKLNYAQRQTNKTYKQQNKQTNNNKERERERITITTRHKLLHLGPFYTMHNDQYIHQTPSTPRNYQQNLHSR